MSIKQSGAYVDVVFQMLYFPVKPNYVEMTQSPTGPQTVDTPITIVCISDSSNPTVRIGWLVDDNPGDGADSTESGCCNALRTRSELAITTARELNGAIVNCSALYGEDEAVVISNSTTLNITCE